MSIHGKGIVTAMIILIVIHDIHRFSNQEKLASYIELTPTSHSSVEKDAHGEMINSGNKFLKESNIESAWATARVNPVLPMDFIGYWRRMKEIKQL